MTKDVSGVVELLPCPFCGASGKQLVPSSYCMGTGRQLRMKRAQYSHRIHCIGCGANNENAHPTAEAAAEAWNRRAALASPTVAGDTGSPGLISTRLEPPNHPLANPPKAANTRTHNDP